MLALKEETLSLFKSLLCGTLVLSFLQYGTAQQVPANATPKTLIGYATDASATEQQWEQKFRAIPEPDQVRENMRRLSAFPHHVGSAYDKDNAEWMLAKFKAWGFDAQIEEFEVGVAAARGSRQHPVGDLLAVAVGAGAAQDDPDSGHGSLLNCVDGCCVKQDYAGNCFVK